MRKSICRIISVIAITCCAILPASAKVIHNGNTIAFEQSILSVSGYAWGTSTNVEYLTRYKNVGDPSQCMFTSL